MTPASENLRRFRIATVVCFSAAVLLLIVAASQRNPYAGFRQSAASLGAAFWVVGLGLGFFAFYFKARVRATQQ